MNWVSKIVVGAIAAIVVYLLCVFVGSLLVAVEVPVVAAAGAFLKTFAGLLSLVAFLYYAFVGNVPWQRP